MKRTALATVLLLLLTSRELLAADPLEDFPDPAAAQTLFVEARALIQQRRFSEACPKLEESQRLVPSVGTQLDLADCHEKIGNVASAWRGFLDVAARSKAANDTEREKAATKRALALVARLPKLVIEVPNASQGLEVKRDGIAVDAAAWGTELPVDPGRHRVTVTAPGKRRWVTTVQTPEGTTTRVAVPRDVTAPPPPDAPAPIGPAPASSDAPVPPEASPSEIAELPPPPPPDPFFPPPVLEEPVMTQRTLAWLVAGAGAVGLGVGTGFALASLGDHEDARGHCAGDICDATGVGLRDDAMRNGNIATVSTVVGVAALVGGLVIALTTPKRFEMRSLSGSR